MRQDSTILRIEIHMIRLRNEGPIKSAPRLKGFAEEVSTEIQSWPGIIAATHWQRGNSTRVDGAEFHVKEGGELGHIHLDGEFHLIMSKPLRTQLVKLDLAQPFIFHQDWVTESIASAKAADQAIWLFRIGYDRLCSTPEEDLFSRIRTRAGEHSSGINYGTSPESA